MSKYNALWKYVKSSNEDACKLSFTDIENVLSFPIDHSFLTYKKELTAFGYEVGKISMKDQTVLFRRAETCVISVAPLTLKP